MLDKNIVNLIENFAKRELSHGLGNAAFFRLEDGSYEIFNKFRISNSDNKILVESTSYRKHFNYLKNAVTWCILYKRNMVGEMMILEELDNKLSGIELSIAQHQRLIKVSKNMDDKILYFTKLNEDILKRKSIERELDRMIKESKQYQLKTFMKPKS